MRFLPLSPPRRIASLPLIEERRRPAVGEPIGGDRADSRIEGTSSSVKHQVCQPGQQRLADAVSPVIRPYIQVFQVNPRRCEKRGKVRKEQGKSGRASAPLRNQHFGVFPLTEYPFFNVSRSSDDFVQQVRDYLSGKSPFLRGTFRMIGMASEVIGADPRTKGVSKVVVSATPARRVLAIRRWAPCSLSASVRHWIGSASGSIREYSA